VPEILFLNSHDGTSAYQLRVGLYRAICTDGLVVSEGHSRFSGSRIGAMSWRMWSRRRFRSVSALRSWPPLWNAWSVRGWTSWSGSTSPVRRWRYAFGEVLRAGLSRAVYWYPAALRTPETTYGARSTWCRRTSFEAASRGAQRLIG
jgi:hypothetical protein